MTARISFNNTRLDPCPGNLQNEFSDPSGIFSNNDKPLHSRNGDVPPSSAFSLGKDRIVW
jgi:hypothetical protein